MSTTIILRNHVETDAEYLPLRIQAWEKPIFDMDLPLFDYWYADNSTFTGITPATREFAWIGRKAGIQWKPVSQAYRPQRSSDAYGRYIQMGSGGNLDATNNGNMVSPRGKELLVQKTGWWFAACVSQAAAAAAGAIIGNQNGPQSATYNTSTNTRFTGIGIGNSASPGQAIARVSGDNKRSLGVNDLRTGVAKLIVASYNYSTYTQTLYVNGVQKDQDVYSNSDLNVGTSLQARSELRLGATGRPGEAIDLQFIGKIYFAAFGRGPLEGDALTALTNAVGTQFSVA